MCIEEGYRSRLLRRAISPEKAKMPTRCPSLLLGASRRYKSRSADGGQVAKHVCPFATALRASGHSVLCPYDGNPKTEVRNGANREIGAPRERQRRRCHKCKRCDRMPRSHAGGTPGQARAANSGSPSKLPSCVRASRVNELPHSTGRALPHSADGGQVAKYVCRAQRAVPLRRQPQNRRRKKRQSGDWRSQEKATTPAGRRRCK